MTLMNKFYRVAEPCAAWALIGHIPNNTYVGNSRATSPVYLEVELKPGAEVHDLVGGTFLVQDGSPPRVVMLQKPYARNVLLSYGQRQADIPDGIVGAKIQEISADAAKNIGNSYRSQGGSDHSFPENSDGVVRLDPQTGGNQAMRLAEPALVEELAEDLFDIVKWPFELDEPDEVPSTGPGR